MPPLSVSDILVRARERAKQMNLPYAGALLPAEAQALLEQVPGAKLIECRTQPEWEYVGHVPNSVLVEWNTYATGQHNQQFLQELESKVPKTDAPVMLLCRSGARSHQADVAATRSRYTNSFNVLERFAPDKHAVRHRNSVGRWRFAVPSRIH